MALALHEGMSPGQIAEGLNDELVVIQGLHVPRTVALGGLYQALERIGEDYEAGWRNGEVPTREPSGQDELVEIGNQLGGMFEKNAQFGRRRYEFMDTLGRLLVTKTDGTILPGGLNPNHVGSGSAIETKPDGSYFGSSIQCEVEGNEPDRMPPYGGDSSDLIKLFVSSDQLSGRIVDVHPTDTDHPQEGQIGVWVWPKGRRDPSTPKAKYLDLLEPTATIVSNMTGAKLPSPRTHLSPHRFAGMD